MGLIAPKGGPWITFNGYEPIHSDGTYYYTVFLSIFDSARDYPLFIGASDEGQTFTMLAEIPRDLGIENADLTIDINPTTTVASQMICPGGVYPPPANTWCYSDPKTPSTSNTGMISLLDKALAGSLIDLQTGTPPEWGTFASGFLNETATFAAIKSNLTAQGVPFDPATAASIAALIKGATPSLISPPRGGSSGSSSSSSSSGGTGCKLHWDCGTSKQCASVYGMPIGDAPQPNAATCASTCKAQGACTCQGC